ncbi:MAG: Undecaprenyl diphosphate synthase [uncultured Thermomicrobiales bacterium]|uniref:Isoprenyl transferase n=1 Tax=uncultured Thermomicrobiales bacterium TaxID=1645740 RepID=A0A6J4U660_9BACT|nr:MAG: Undecaprenyl diphosphate synthase [uncultured Thermomicrobiales bacterium]
MDSPTHNALPDAASTPTPTSSARLTAPLDQPEIGPPAVPTHVAVIMDGNGRWAKRRGLARIEGHERGTDNIRRITYAAAELGVRYLTLWAFSTENWRRPTAEVDGILRILGEVLAREVEELHRQGAQLRHIGSLEGLPTGTRQAVLDAIELTKDNERLVLTLAFNYGGRQEMVRAVREMLAAGLDPETIDENTIAAHLDTRDLPDPDLIIRTSGEHRMSNFLIWQAAYAELFFTPVLWPDFGPDDLRAALADYAQRERRFGHITAAVAPGR